MRIWFAEGKVKGSVLPTVPVKTLVILHHTEGKTAEGAKVMQHQAEIVVHTDSKAAAVVSKIMGQSTTVWLNRDLASLSFSFPP